jgi:hypothetical protein
MPAAFYPMTLNPKNHDADPISQDPVGVASQYCTKQKLIIPSLTAKAKTHNPRATSCGPIMMARSVSGLMVDGPEEFRNFPSNNTSACSDPTERRLFI